MRAKRLLVIICAVGILASCSSTTSSSQSSSSSSGASPGASSSGSAPSADPAMAASIDKLMQDNMAKRHLKAAIVRVTIDGKDVLTKAYGESMSGVPATTDMHFRNGAIVLSYLSTLLLKLVDQGKVSLDDKASKWVPEIAHSDEVTLGQLAQMTSGYADYVLGNPDANTLLYTDPYRQWTSEEVLALKTPEPLLYTPGTNWNYSHTNYWVLGLALEKATGKTMADLLHDDVLAPLGLNDTNDNGSTPNIPEPALHAFTSERRQFLGVPDGTRLYEDATFWNPSWTILGGAVETTDIHDLAETAAGIGSGKLLSAGSYAQLISTDLRGKTTALPACPATCFPQSDKYSYGLGIISTGDWLIQDPLFAGEASAFAFLPSKKVAIAVVTTFAEKAFAADGSYVPETSSNAANRVWRDIAAIAAPTDAPPA
ncbi:MAG: beta-lactamase family protein [Actinomycetota bacterium]|nr:beta-lactamase family protein [Actinomycetota bacterium]